MEFWQVVDLWPTLRCSTRLCWHSDALSVGLQSVFFFLTKKCLARTYFCPAGDIRHRRLPCRWSSHHIRLSQAVRSGGHGGRMRMRRVDWSGKNMGSSQMDIQNQVTVRKLATRWDLIRQQLTTNYSRWLLVGMNCQIQSERRSCTCSELKVSKFCWASSMQQFELVDLGDSKEFEFDILKKTRNHQLARECHSQGKSTVVS